MIASAPRAGAGTERLARGARRVSALTMLSRVLGLVREQIFALTLGAGVYSDAFLAAFRIPNLLRDLFAEGALSTAFVPTYVSVLKNESRAAAYALANRVLSTLTIYLGTIAALGMLFPQPVVALVATGFGPEKAALCQQLVRIMMPFLPAISLAVVAMGALNAEERYTAPALASSMFNVVAILGGAVVYFIAPGGRIAVDRLVGADDRGRRWRSSASRSRRCGAWGFGPSCCRICACAIPGTRRIAALMAPATLGVAAVQINVVVNSSFASLVSDGAISWLSYAFRLMQLPIGVFGVAVGTTSLTHLSRDAAARDWDALRATLRRGLRMVLFLTVPSTIGLALLGVPIIRLIYQHGRFSSAATMATAHALSGYALGLVSYAAIKVVAPAFYALGRTRVPLIASVSAVAANLLWNLTTFHRFGHVGLAVGTSLAATVNLAVLLVAFQIADPRALHARLLRRAWRASRWRPAVMAAVVWPLSTRLEPLELPPRVLGWAIKVFVPVGSAPSSTSACARLLKLARRRRRWRCGAASDPSRADGAGLRG